MIYDLNVTDIKPSIKSDHSILTISFKIQNTQKRGKGFWKFNNSLLKDLTYIRKIKLCLTECKTKYKELSNKSLMWDTIKCELRTLTFSYSCFKAKERNSFEKKLKDRIDDLQTKNSLGELQYLPEFNSTKKDLEEIYLEKGKGAMVRSRA